MAYTFDMQIRFTEEQDNQIFVEQINKVITPFRHIDFHPLHATLIFADGNRSTQLAWTPKRVGIAVSFDEQREQPVDDELAFELAQHMYDTLRHCDGFFAAVVGWEIVNFASKVDPSRDDNDLEDVLDGIVVPKANFKHWQQDPRFVEFNDTHFWQPITEMMGNMW